MRLVGKRTAAGVGRRRFLRACAKLLAACPVWATAAQAARRSSVGGGNWIAFYGQTADEEVLASYDIVILEPMFQGSIAAIAELGATLRGYVSLGKIRMDDPYYAEVDPAALLDVMHQSWTALVIDRIIPAVAAKGFTGLLLPLRISSNWTRTATAACVRLRLPSFVLFACHFPTCFSS